MDLLRDPVWQGIGAITSIIALILYMFVERQKLFPQIIIPDREKLRSTTKTSTRSSETELHLDSFFYTFRNAVIIGATGGMIVGVVAILFLFLTTIPLAIFIKIGLWGFVITGLLGLVVAGLNLFLYAFMLIVGISDAFLGEREIAQVLLSNISLLGGMALSIFLAKLMFPSIGQTLELILW